MYVSATPPLSKCGRVECSRRTPQNRALTLQTLFDHLGLVQETEAPEPIQHSGEALGPPARRLSHNKGSPPKAVHAQVAFVSHGGSSNSLQPQPTHVRRVSRVRRARGVEKPDQSPPQVTVGSTLPGPKYKHPLAARIVQAAESAIRFGLDHGVILRSSCTSAVWDDIRYGCRELIVCVHVLTFWLAATPKPGKALGVWSTNATQHSSAVLCVFDPCSRTGRAPFIA